eukprot:UN02695
MHSAKFNESTYNTNQFLPQQVYNSPAFVQLKNKIYSFILQYSINDNEPDPTNPGNNNNNGGGSGSGNGNGNNNINRGTGLGYYIKKGQPNDPIPDDFRPTGSYQQYNRWYTIPPRDSDYIGYATFLSISLASIFVHLSVAPAERAVLYSYTTLPQDVITRLGQLPASSPSSPSSSNESNHIGNNIKIRPNEPWLKGTLSTTPLFMSRHIITFFLFYMIIPTLIWPTTYRNARTKYQYDQPSQFEEFWFKFIASAIAGVFGANFYI